MSTIFLDESGYTGQDLLNAEQPFFAIASLRLDEVQSQELKQNFFGRIQAKELKHGSMAKYFTQQRMVIDFLHYLSQHLDIVKVGIIHKQYALICKVVEWAVEPAAHEIGIDLYRGGGNIALANLIFYTFPLFGGDDFFDSFLSTFQTMMRLRSQESYDNFFGLVFKRYDSDKLNEILKLIQTFHYALGFEEIHTFPDNALDLPFSLAFNQMGEWRQQITGDIFLIHDESSYMNQHKALWDAIMSPDLPVAVHGYDRRKIHLPIAVNTTFGSSKDWVGLQLADLVAGAFVRAAGWYVAGQNRSDSYGEELFKILDQIPCFRILPSPAITPEELGTVD